MNHLHVFVKANLLSNKETTDALRDFFSNASTEISNYCLIDFVNGKIIATPHDKLYEWAMGNLIGQKLDEGYFLIQISYLKKILSF